MVCRVSAQEKCSSTAPKSVNIALQIDTDFFQFTKQVLAITSNVFYFVHSFILNKVIVKFDSLLLGHIWRKRRFHFLHQ